MIEGMVLYQFHYTKQKNLQIKEQIDTEKQDTMQEL